MTKLRGVIAPFTTPFSEDGSINYSLIKPQVDWLIENGVHGLAAGGSTGEGHALTRDEYLSVIRETINAIDYRIPLVAGIIANSTSEVIERGLSVKEMNVEALQITPPSYLFKPDDDAMVKHFDEISKKCNLGVKIVSKSSFKTFDRNKYTNKSGLLVYKGFRSICPVTSQPDWGNIYIYSSSNTLNKKEIYNFLFSLRNHCGFHENCVEKIFLYIKETFSIDHLEICGRFLRRGGIDINPIRSSQKKLFFTNFREFNQ